MKRRETRDFAVIQQYFYKNWVYKSKIRYFESVTVDCCCGVLIPTHLNTVGIKNASAGGKEA